MAIALPAWLLAAQMTMEIATASLVLVDMLVNPFMADRRCPPWRAKRRRVVAARRHGIPDVPKAPKGIPREHPNAASSHMGGRCVAATSLRCCGGTPGDQDGRGTNELSKVESILGTRMSQNLSRDRRLACTPSSRVSQPLICSGLQSSRSSCSTRAQVDFGIRVRSRSFLRFCASLWDCSGR